MEPTSPATGIDVHENGFSLRAGARTRMASLLKVRSGVVAESRMPATAVLEALHRTIPSGEAVPSGETGSAAAHVVIGIDEDPLDPVRRKLPLMLALLEALRDAPRPRVRVQTRSPLILLLLPLLRSLGATVYIALETERDDVASTLTPGAPRPSERLAAARTLAAQEIETTLQVAPLLPCSYPRAAIYRLVRTLGESPCRSFVVPPAAVWPAGCLPRSVHPDAGAALYRALGAMYPERIVRHDPTFLQRAGGEAGRRSAAASLQPAFARYDARRPVR